MVVAVLVVGLPWCRTGQSGFIGDGQATIVSDSRESEAHAHLEPLVQEILQSTTTDQQLGDYLAQDPQLRRELGVEEEATAIEILRRRMEINHQRVGGEITIGIHFYAGNRESCSQLIANVLEDFQREFNDWKREKVSNIEGTYSGQLEEAKTRVVAIDAELRGLHEGIPAAPAPVATITPPTRQVNPEWSAAMAAVSQAEDELRNMLETRTDSHPVVINQRRKVEEVRQSLSVVPQYAGSEPKPLPKPQLEPTPNNNDRRIADLRQQRQQAAARLNSINGMKKDADKALGFLNGIVMHVPGDQFRVASIGGSWKSTALLVLGGWAIFAGLISFQFASSAAQPNVVSTSGKLAAVSPIPVLATVTVDAAIGPPPAKPWPLRRVSFWITRLAELTILGVVALVVLATQTQPEYSQLLKDDPLAAVREVLRVLPGRVT
ncbi:hypothetical protein AB1L30_02950 [Bremerella sp. JC817]|uniref:hypothetical protein n=1 Tax=Bremerella sp. JC817 TaxID=3231756 RepID=UPI00345A4252